MEPFATHEEIRDEASRTLQHLLVTEPVARKMRRLKDSDGMYVFMADLHADGPDGWFFDTPVYVIPAEAAAPDDTR